MVDFNKEPKATTCVNIPISTRGLLDKAAAQFGASRSSMLSAILREWLSERYEDRKLHVASMLADGKEEANV